MTTGLVKGFWTFLNTDIRELPWGELAKTGVEAGKTLVETAKAVQEQAPSIQVLAPLAQDHAQFLTMLNSPIAQLAGAGLPVVSIAITLAKIYLDHSQTDPTLTDSVVLVSQIAYLASLEEVLGTSEQIKAALGKTSLKDILERQIHRLDTRNLTEIQAKTTQVCFHDSALAIEFNQAVQAKLKEVKTLPDVEIQRFVERVAWNTYRYFNQALAETADKVKPLAELYRIGGQQVLEKSVSLDEYLRDYISPDSTVPTLADRWRVFNEPFTLPDIYVPPQAQRMDRNGVPLKDRPPEDLTSWVMDWLNDIHPQKDRVMFIQGGPGRGKSAFCRMFAEQIRQHEHPRWTPILIRLRDVESLEKDFEETLRQAIDRDFTRSDAGWLTDRNTRFLFLLDGFDELLMEGRTSGGLEEFLGQVGSFQRRCYENPEKGHRVLVTGRTLSLQSIERRMPQNLERLEILPMDDTLQEQWLSNWGRLVQTQLMPLQDILRSDLLPERVKELAREPLLLYLLAAMHRNGKLHLDMFAGADGIQAKVLIYEQAISWVLTEQRPAWLNRDLTELDTDGLRRILAEAGLCVVQSGREYGAMNAIETRLENDFTVKSLLALARDRIQDNPLRNALAAFYLQPGNSGGSVEFIHKSFGEFLCAERLKQALESWSNPGDSYRGERFLVDDATMHWEIYDFLGYGGLTPEIVEYLMALLTASSVMEPEKWVSLFQRLNDFYQDWCQGLFMDALPENIPQKKMRLLKGQRPDGENLLGLIHVDVFTGLNCLSLLLELHRYAQGQSDLQAKMFFYPSNKELQLLKIMHYSDSISHGRFAATSGYFFSNANLSKAYLVGANLSQTNLVNANLDSANLDSANLSGSNLDGACLDNTCLNLTNLSDASLERANLDNAYLDNANLTNANLAGASLKMTLLARANLKNANLTSADLTNASLPSTDLNNACLARANFDNADLSNAYLVSADFSSANLCNTNLSGAYLHHVNLRRIAWNQDTDWTGVRGLETAQNVPEALKQQLGLGIVKN